MPRVPHVAPYARWYTDPGHDDRSRPPVERRAASLAGQASTPFAATLDHDFIGLSEASAIHNFLKRAAADVQRTLRRRIQVNSFEAACRMIEANVGVGVLPEGTARRHAKTMALRVVALEDDWAERELQLCVADLDALPRFARDLVDPLVEAARSQPD